MLPSARSDRVRYVVGDSSVGPLISRQIAQPTIREAGDVEQERRGRSEDLPIAGPARSFPVGTVGGHLTCVAAKAEDGCLVQGVEPGIAASEEPGAGQIG